MKKFCCAYRHNGKYFTMYLRARNFDHARDIVDTAYESKNYQLIDFEDEYTSDEQWSRIRSAKFNGEIQQIVLTIPLPF